MFKIGNQKVGDEYPTFIIAEAGSNHNGDLDTAKKLIDEAAEAGADAVKFQVFRADKLYVDDTEQEDSAYDVVSELEMPYEWIPELYDYCRSQDVYFMATPFDEESAEKIVEYVPAFKIASFSISHYPLLRHLAQYDKPLIMSTGAHTESEISNSVQYLDGKTEELALLHCVSSYPTEIEDINVKAVETLQEKYGRIAGLSDHTTNPGIPPSAAVTLGASIVEKHFTLDKDMEGPDHSFALNPEELNEMINDIRKTEKALGKGSISISEAESTTVDRARRMIFADAKIEEGDKITEDSIKVLRPGEKQEEGLSGQRYEEVLGLEALEEIEKDEAVSMDKIDFKEADE
jgi:N,N'-diacetyllegionaminate synthase